MPTTTSATSRLPLGDNLPDELARVLDAVARGVAEVAGLLARPTPEPRSDKLDVESDVTNASGDVQAELDRRAHDVFVLATADAPLRALASEEADEPIVITGDAPYGLAIDPLDGSSNIGINAPVGTIFSVLDVGDLASADPDAIFCGDGGRVIASGIALYGARTNLVLALAGDAVVYTLDPSTGAFERDGGPLEIPGRTTEYAINASNYRHWPPPIRHYVDHLIAGTDGPRGEDANTRWVAAVVADAYRILMRGGVYLYPDDRREGYVGGRLRLLYEGHPIAYLIEAAGGAATDGERRLLDVAVTDIHQRTPLVFGSATEVARIAGYYETPFVGTQSPLFGQRGLFRG